MDKISQLVQQNRKLAVITALFFAIVVVITPFVMDLLHFQFSESVGWLQLVVEALLFPFTIIGFLIAVAEFQKSQTYAVLALDWKGDMATTVDARGINLEVPNFGEKGVDIRLCIKNIGEGVTIWYSIGFDVPSTLSPVNSELHKVTWHIGDEHNHATGQQLDATRHTFMSNGKFALYPDVDPLHYATLHLIVSSRIAYPTELEINYFVATDKSKIQRGALKICTNRQVEKPPMFTYHKPTGVN